MKNSHALLLIFAVFVTLFVGAVYGYMYYRIDMSAQKIVEAQSIIQSAKLSKQREKSFLETYKATASKWATLQEYFVKSNKVVDFIEVVEAIGPQSQSTIAISSIEADNLDSAPLGKEGRVKMKVSSKGSWNATMKALTLAEMLPYKITISNVRASSFEGVASKGSAPKTTWELSFDLQAAMIAASSSPAISK